MKLNADMTNEQYKGYIAGIQDALDYITKRTDKDLDIDIDKFVEFLNSRIDLAELGIKPE